jgi:hypothetical protein
MRVQTNALLNWRRQILLAGLVVTQVIAVRSQRMETQGNELVQLTPAQPQCSTGTFVVSCFNGGSVDLSDRHVQSGPHRTCPWQTTGEACDRDASITPTGLAPKVPAEAIVTSLYMNSAPLPSNFSSYAIFQLSAFHQLTSLLAFC